MEEYHDANTTWALFMNEPCALPAPTRLQIHGMILKGPFVLAYYTPYKAFLGLPLTGFVLESNDHILLIAPLSSHC